MISGAIEIYLALDTVDLRGAFEQLCAVTRTVLGMEPSGGALFLFVNRKRNRLKAIWWDRNGYVLLYKRMARGSFPWPSVDTKACSCVEISAQDFARLLAGLPIEPIVARTRYIH